MHHPECHRGIDGREPCAFHWGMAWQFLGSLPYPIGCGPSRRRVPKTRVFAALMTAALLAGGCENLPSLPPPPPKPAPPEPLVVPLDGAVGRVQSVNERLRFVVLDYSLNQMPALGDRLDVIRSGKMVGELKVTGPFRNASVVADIVSGTSQEEDVTRGKAGTPVSAP